jgi:hypothetical protein
MIVDYFSVLPCQSPREAGESHRGRGTWWPLNEKGFEPDTCQKRNKVYSVSEKGKSWWSLKKRFPYIKDMFDVFSIFTNITCVVRCAFVHKRVDKKRLLTILSAKWSRFILYILLFLTQILYAFLVSSIALYALFTSFSLIWFGLITHIMRGKCVWRKPKFVRSLLSIGLLLNLSLGIVQAIFYYFVYISLNELFSQNFTNEY